MDIRVGPQHGAPSLENAHPHKAGKVAVVHNGIIENFKALRDELNEKGAEFRTETDTETIVQLCMKFIDDGASPQEAAEKTIARLEGAFALCFLFDGEEDLLIAARKGSPLAIGHGTGEMFVGSDAIALAPMTNKITYLDEGDWAVITRNSLEIRDASGTLANREMRELDLSTQSAEKGAHKHYMAKEIAEQPSVLSGALSYYLNKDRTQITLPDIDLDFSKIDKITLVACGTAYLACNVAKYWFEQIARIPVELDVASEFRYREPPMIGPHAWPCFVSQSGETADTLAALALLRISRQVQDCLGIVNVARKLDCARKQMLALPIHAGALKSGLPRQRPSPASCSVLLMLALC